MTGTPVQNRLSDFASLLKFLRVHPYDHQRTFEAHISNLWKDGNDEEAINRLKRLVNCIVLRRLKTTIELPVRRDATRFAEFTTEERHYYEEASNPVKQLLENALWCEDTSPSIFLNAFQRINKLRMICNLGLSTPIASSRFTPPSSSAETWSGSTAQAYFESLLSVGQAACSVCSVSLDDSSASEANESLFVPGPSLPRLSKCLKLFCSTCFIRLQDEATSAKGSGCGHYPPCPAELVLATSSAPSTPLPSLQGPSFQVSSKIKLLVEDIKAHSDEKR